MCVRNVNREMEHINALLFIKHLSLVKIEEAVAALQSKNLLKLIRWILCALCVGRTG